MSGFDGKEHLMDYADKRSDMYHEGFRSMYGSEVREEFEEFVNSCGKSVREMPTIPIGPLNYER